MNSCYESRPCEKPFFVCFHISTTLTMFRNPLTSIWLVGRILGKGSASPSGLVHRQWLRFLSSTAYKPVARTAPRIPDIMLVYHAGTWRTTLLGVTKAATIIVFVYGAIEMAPRAWKDPDTGPWISAAGRHVFLV